MQSDYKYTPSPGLSIHAKFWITAVLLIVALGCTAVFAGVMLFAWNLFVWPGADALDGAAAIGIALANLYTYGSAIWLTLMINRNIWED